MLRVSRRAAAGFARSGLDPCASVALAAVAGHCLRQVHSVLRHGSAIEDPTPSLRARLEADASALEASQGEGRTHHLLRSPAAVVAARLAKHAQCHLDPGTPRYIQSAMEPSTSQTRVIADIAPPHRITWASPAWQVLTGLQEDAVVGRPALATLLAAESSSGEVSGIAESLFMQQRGCGTVACRTANRGHAVPARVTVSPLMNSLGETANMLFVVRHL